MFLNIRIFQSLVLVFLFFWLTGCGEPEIVGQCSTNGFGQVDCSFHNTGGAEGSACVNILLTPTSDNYYSSIYPNGINSNEICSGIVRANDVVERSQSGGFPMSPSDYCRVPGKSSWITGCSMTTIDISHTTESLIGNSENKDMITFTLILAAICFFVFILPNIVKRASNNSQKLSNPAYIEENKKCPFCAETIKSEAKICRFCQKEIPPEPNPIEPTEPLLHQGDTLDETSRERAGWELSAFAIKPNSEATIINNMSDNAIETSGEEIKSVDVVPPKPVTHWIYRHIDWIFWGIFWIFAFLISLIWGGWDRFFSS